jgi:hypothetical protein
MHALRFLLLGVALAAAAWIGRGFLAGRRHARRSRAAEPGPSPVLLADLGERVATAKASRPTHPFELVDLGELAAAAAEAGSDGPTLDNAQLVEAVADRLGEVPASYHDLVAELARIRGRGLKTLRGRTLDELAGRAATLRAESPEDDPLELLLHELHPGPRVPRAVRAVAEAAVGLAQRRVPA